jgi:Resolvase, N terminal domain
MKAAIYARVSTFDQEPENQLAELRRYVDARGWSSASYVDKGVSGGKRPASDALVADGAGEDSTCWGGLAPRRLGRNRRHLILQLDELTALGITFVSLGEGIDTSTSAGTFFANTSAGRRSKRNRIRVYAVKPRQCLPIALLCVVPPGRWTRFGRSFFRRDRHRSPSHAATPAGLRLGDKPLRPRSLNPLGNRSLTFSVLLRQSLVSAVRALASFPAGIVLGSVISLGELFPEPIRATLPTRSGTFPAGAVAAIANGPKRSNGALALSVQPYGFHRRIENTLRNLATYALKRESASRTRRL